MRTIVIGGSPGAGKSSASKKLADSIKNSVLIETDHFFEYLTEPVDPSTSAAKAQNETVISAYTEATNAYRKGGYTVILEGVIGPWLFPILVPTLGRFNYFLLHTSLDTVRKRVSSRSSKQVSLGKVARMHPQFEKVLADYGNHVIDTENSTPDAVAMKILAKIEDGCCEVCAA